MPVTRQNIEDALALAIDDEAMSDDNIRIYEIVGITKRFAGLMAKLEDEAEEEDDDVDDDDDDDDIDEEDGKG